MARSRVERLTIKRKGSVIRKFKIALATLSLTVAAGAWQLLSPPGPAASSPNLTRQVTNVSNAPSPPYADDDDSDEAEVWRLKQERDQGPGSHDPLRDPSQSTQRPDNEVIQLVSGDDT